MNFNINWCYGLSFKMCLLFNPFTWDDSVKPKKYVVDKLYDEVKLDNLYFLQLEVA